jgi:error-prone DNA polymerase
MFTTIEDETGVANLVIWPSLYGRQRRIILAAGMIAVQGRIQREGEVVHLVANQRRTRWRLPVAAWPPRRIPSRRPGIDPRSLPPKGPKPRDIYAPDLHIDSIKVKTRDFR